MHPLSQIHVSISYIFYKLIILLFLGITSAVYRQKVSNIVIECFMLTMTIQQQRMSAHTRTMATQAQAHPNE